MFLDYLPHPLPENWLISEIDQDNEYLEFLGHNGEFLVSIMKHEYDNPEKPYYLSLSQLKGILGRYDFESLEWPEWFKSSKESVESALTLMEWINDNCSKFIPLTLEVWICVGTEDQKDIIQRYFEDVAVNHDDANQGYLYSRLSLTRTSATYSVAAIERILHFLKTVDLPFHEFKGGLLTNEKFQLIDDLRPSIAECIKSQQYEAIC